MDKVNVVLDGSNEEASKRLAEIIRSLEEEKKNNN